MQTRSLFALLLFTFFALSRLLFAQTTAPIEVEKFNARGFSKLYLVKLHLPFKDAVAYFHARDASLVTADNQKDLENLSDAAFDRKIGAPVNLRVVQGVMMAGTVPYKWPSRKKDREAHQQQFVSFNFQDKVDSGWVVVGEKHAGGTAYAYRGRPDDWTHQYYIVQTDNPDRLRDASK